MKKMAYKNLNTGEIIVCDFGQTDIKARKEFMNKIENPNHWVNHFGDTSTLISGKDLNSSTTQKARKDAGWNEVLNKIQDAHPYAQFDK